MYYLLELFTIGVDDDDNNEKNNEYSNSGIRDRRPRSPSLSYSEWLIRKVSGHRRVTVSSGGGRSRRVLVSVSTRRRTTTLSTSLSGGSPKTGSSCHSVGGGRRSSSSVPFPSRPSGATTASGRPPLFVRVVLGGGVSL